METFGRAQELLDEFVARFPEELRQAIAAHFDDRAAKGYVHTKTLGHSYAVAIAKDLGLENTELSHLIAFACTLGNTYYEILDLAVDAKYSRSNPRELDLLIIGDLFLQRLWETVHGVFRDCDAAWRVIRRHLNECAQAMLWEETNHVGLCTPYDPQELIRLGGKSAPVKTLAYGLASAAGRDDLQPCIDNLVDHVAAGLQLMDDLTDWESDFLAQRYTYPLTLGIQCEGIDVSAPPENWRDRLRRSIFLGPVFREVTDLSIEHLSTAVQAARGIGDATTGTTMEKMEQVKARRRHLTEDQVRMYYATLPYVEGVKTPDLSDSPTKEKEDPR